ARDARRGTPPPSLLRRRARGGGSRRLTCRPGFREPWGLCAKLTSGFEARQVIRRVGTRVTGTLLAIAVLSGGCRLQPPTSGTPGAAPQRGPSLPRCARRAGGDRKSTRLNSSHVAIS